MQLKPDGCICGTIYFHIFTVYIFNPIISLNNKRITGPGNALKIKRDFQSFEALKINTRYLHDL